jgi:hypothetical protein
LFSFSQPVVVEGRYDFVNLEPPQEFVAKEVEFASVMHQASRAADLERELKSSSDYCGKMDQSNRSGIFSKQF